MNGTLTAKSPALFFMIGGRKSGPHTRDEVSRLISGRKIVSQTLAWRQGLKGWQAASQLSELASLFKAAPAPARPAAKPSAPSKAAAPAKAPAPVKPAPAPAKPPAARPGVTVAGFQRSGGSFGSGLLVGLLLGLVAGGGGAFFFLRKGPIEESSGGDAVVVSERENSVKGEEAATEEKAPVPAPAEPKPELKVEPKPEPKKEAAEGKKIEKHPWASFQVGSFVKTKSVTKTEVMGNKSDSVVETKQTLLELTEEKAVIETETVMAGMDPIKNTFEMPRRVVDAPVQNKGSEPKKGRETVKVAAGSFDCEWIETTQDEGGNKTVTRMWTCDSVPGNFVKMVLTLTGSMTMESTTELVEVSAK